jgi:hypothetical protein
MSGEKVADAFAKLAQVADRTEGGNCALNIEYVADGDRLLPGDLIPTITLSLQRQETATVVVDPDKVIDEEARR